MQRDAALLRGVGQCKCRPDAGRGDQHRLAGEVAKVGVTRAEVTGAEVRRAEVTGAVVVAGIPPGLSCSSWGLAVLMFKSVEVQGRK